MVNLKIMKVFWLLLIAANTSANEINDVKTIFEHLEVVPDVVPSAPNRFLKVTYANDLEVKAGIELTPTQVKSQPLVEWEADQDSFYTLIMSDPDAPSRHAPKFREFKHWLVGNIPNNDISKGEILSAYVGSGPPKNSGLHRYVFLLYKQKGKLEFNEARIGNNSREERPNFRAANFASKYDLDYPVAGNFYQAQWDEYVPFVHKQLSGN
ncbi:PREDICTED: protein D3-like isoform X1 [Bactrocera latifrons]|uniref:Phosphatidylethanolamine-binding F40A3.3 n=1 Tax=Bactrocera latifrons TaxID=174628 RepID=A0A0K8W045_BACLA|nr:PREDICTED: protein D3-like isoform X1 [Bactrocera latifrons]